jgi:hypothetical protein
MRSLCIDVDCGGLHTVFDGQLIVPRQAESRDRVPERGTVHLPRLRQEERTCATMHLQKIITKKS